MGAQLDQLREGLAEFQRMKRLKPIICVTFEVNANEHWIQVASSHVNMDWPLSDRPEAKQLDSHFGAVGPIKVTAWAADEYLTFDFDESKLDLLPPILDRVCRELYELREGYTLSFSIV